MNFRNLTSAASENMDFDGAPLAKSTDGRLVASRLVVELVPSGWTGSLTVQARFSPGGAFRAVPYRRLFTNADVAAGTPITDADVATHPVIEVSTPGVWGLRLVHTRTAGQVEANVTALAG